jgi:predicted secreted Zn-dependent protease
MNKQKTNGHTEITEKIARLEKEVENLQPNGSCKNVRRDADVLLAKIRKLKEKQELHLEQQEI